VSRRAAAVIFTPPRGATFTVSSQFPHGTFIESSQSPAAGRLRSLAGRFLSVARCTKNLQVPLVNEQAPTPSVRLDMVDVRRLASLTPALAADVAVALEHRLPQPPPNSGEVPLPTRCISSRHWCVLLCRAMQCRHHSTPTYSGSLRLIVSLLLVWIVSSRTY